MRDQEWEKLHLPRIWHQTQTFAFSGLDGETSWFEPFVGQTLFDPPGIIFHTREDQSGNFRMIFAARTGSGIEKFKAVNAEPQVVGPDVIDVSFALDNGSSVRYLMAWMDRKVVLGRSQAEGCNPVLLTDGAIYPSSEITGSGPGIVYEGEAMDKGEWKALVMDPEDGRDEFMIGCWGDLADQWARSRSNDIHDLASKYLGFYKNLEPPEEAERGIRETYVKACAIMKANIETPCGEIEYRWSPPDRWPHRHMWLWDEAFNSIGAMYLDVQLARDCIMAALSKQRNDGFIPHTMAPDPEYDSNMTQPPILAWASMKIHKMEPSEAFLQEIYGPLQAYLAWDFSNMDRLGTGLLQWQFDGADSGMDNSPRFDDGPDFDAVDLNCFVVRECESLALMARELGKKNEAEKWLRVAGQVSHRINERLWNDVEGFYYDRRKDGSWIKIKTVDGFLPLFSGTADTRKATILVGDHLTNESEFWPSFPIPSVALSEDSFELDMWRGPTWINYNYLITEGLNRMGYREVANRLRDRTLAEISRWRRLRSSLYEFYDPFGERAPQDLKRKGRVRKWPEDGIPVISDFFWSSALFVDMCASRYGS